jgi:hypothetical protein
MGHHHIVAFLRSLKPRSDEPCASSKACKPTSPSDKRECANCGVSTGDRSDLLLKACSRCKLVFYCSEPCQRQHWKKGEHKRFCVAVGDRKKKRTGEEEGWKKILISHFSAKNSKKSIFIKFSHFWAKNAKNQFY